MVNVSSLLFPILFADDTNIFINSKKSVWFVSYHEYRKQDYENLFKGKISDTFDDEFVRNIDSLVSEWDGDNSKLLDYVKYIDQALNLPADDLNAPLSEDETRSALNKAKPNKSPGIDNLPNEILRSPKLFKTLHKLFATCFEYNVIPDMWCKNTISPILKKGKDPLCPLHYRGISIISTVAKVFTNILNTRLTIFLEYNNLMSEEQNGFRKKTLVPGPHIRITVQITFIFIDFRVCDFAFAFKTQNAPCVSRFKRVLFSDRFQFAVLNANETCVWLVTAFDASYIAYYSLKWLCPLHRILSFKWSWPAFSETKTETETKPTQRSQITDQNLRKVAHA